ncbi:ribonuclease Y [bacterium Unc6]|nr:ribonuclease Y [bacterium Unc6]
MENISLFLIIAFVIGISIGVIFTATIFLGFKKKSYREAKQILEDAKKNVQDKIKNAQIEAKEILYRSRSDFEKEIKERRQDILSLEKRLIQREENLERKVDILEKKESNVQTREREIADKEKNIRVHSNELLNLIQEEKCKLQSISGMNSEQAKRLLLERMKDEAQQEASLIIKRIENEAKENAEKNAKEIISLAIQRCAADHTAGATVTVVNLSNDDMKGRIIGREGRNIRALEELTGVELIIDDTPGSVTLSSFDPVRREVARISLECLMADGRIHPGRIEDVVEKVKKEVDNTICEEGERAIFEVGVHNLHPELVKLIGRLKYRTSYGQNVLQHSKETTFLMGVLASELKADFSLARRIGILHDIGKALDHNTEGTHANIGADIARKYGESAEVAQAIESHHEEIEPKGLYAALVQAADAISASRPGARRETVEAYLKRIKKLEEIANVFKGVQNTFAIHAGREIRVIVIPEKISDADVFILAKDIRKKIEAELGYPGQIKVVVIRELRAVEIAK